MKSTGQACRAKGAQGCLHSLPADMSPWGGERMLEQEVYLSSTLCFTGTMKVLGIWRKQTCKLPVKLSLSPDPL